AFARPDRAGDLPAAGHPDQRAVAAPAAGADSRHAAVTALPVAAWRGQQAGRRGVQCPAALPAAAAGAAGHRGDAAQPGDSRSFLVAGRGAGDFGAAVEPGQRLADAASGGAAEPQAGGIMSLDWHGAWLALIQHPLLGVALTLGAYQLALVIYEKPRWVLLQSVLLSIVLVILVLW